MNSGQLLVLALPSLLACQTRFFHVVEDVDTEASPFKVYDIPIDFKGVMVTQENAAEPIPLGKAVESEKPVMIEISTIDCSVCRTFAPVYRSIALKSTNIDHYLLSGDEYFSFIDSLGVRNVPTLIAFKGGKLVFRRIGAIEISSLERIEKELLSWNP